jgi:hypothetical protein
MDDVISYKGQLYRRIGSKPYVRQDGSETRLDIWRSEPVCPVACAWRTLFVAANGFWAEHVDRHVNWMPTACDWFSQVSR